MAETKQILSVNGDRVLIEEQNESKKKTSAGIIIPDNVAMKEATGLQKHVTTGRVLKAGQDCSFVKEGDLVLFGVQDAAPILFNDKNYLVIREEPILFTFNGDTITRINSDRVLIAPNPLSKITEGGIFIPENANYEPTTGTVLKLGSKCKYLKEGSKIIFGKSAGALIEFAGKHYLVSRESDIVGEL